MWGVERVGLPRAEVQRPVDRGQLGCKRLQHFRDASAAECRESGVPPVGRDAGLNLGGEPRSPIRSWKTTDSWDHLEFGLEPEELTIVLNSAVREVSIPS